MASHRTASVSNEEKRHRNRSYHRLAGAWPVGPPVNCRRACQRAGWRSTGRFSGIFCARLYTLGFNNTAVPEMFSTHSCLMGRAPWPLSPPTMTQSMPERLKSPRSSRRAPSTKPSSALEWLADELFAADHNACPQRSLPTICDYTLPRS